MPAIMDRPKKRTKPSTAKPKAEHSEVCVPTPAWAAISIPLLHQREGNWSAGHHIGVGVLLQSSGKVSGSYPDRSAAIAGASTQILDVLHRQLNILDAAGDKRQIQQLLAAVRKFRQKHEAGRKQTSRKGAKPQSREEPAPALVLEDLTGSLCNKCGWPDNKKPKDKDRKPTAKSTKKKISTALVPATSAKPPAPGYRLLENCRKLYESFERSWLALGEAAIEIREARAYETCGTFDEWIAMERMDRSVIYGCMKGAKIYRMLAPAAEPAKLLLDRESHFRAFPADMDEIHAAKIVRRLAKSVKPDDDGLRRPTAKEIKAAVDAELAPHRPDRSDTSDRAYRDVQPVPGMIARGPVVDLRADDGGDAAGVLDGKSAAAADGENAVSGPGSSTADIPPLERPYFPVVETIEQACCVVRSWILKLTRQFPTVDDLTQLDEELYQSCQTVRGVYRPKLQAEAAAAQSAARRAK